MSVWSIARREATAKKTKCVTGNVDYFTLILIHNVIYNSRMHINPTPTVKVFARGSLSQTEMRSSGVVVGC